MPVARKRRLKMRKPPHRLQPRAESPRAVAVEVIEPILRFMQQSGISEKDALRAFSQAWTRAKRDPASKVRLSSLVDPQPYIDAITRWARDPHFLDERGQPRDLAMRGKYGFGGLLKAVQCQRSSNEVLEVLRAYGNVQLLVSGRIRLIKPFLHIRAGKNLAFEPNIQFLVDAARNVRASLDDSPAISRGALRTRGFWRAVEVRDLSTRMHGAYLAYVKQRSLSFLQDVDDWLVEHGKPNSRRRQNRVGIGLFTIGVDR